MSEEKIPGIGPIDLVSNTDKKRLERQQELRDRLIKDVLTVLNTAGGRRIWLSLLYMSGYWKLSFVPNDPHSTSKNEGKREVGKWVFDLMMDAKPEVLAQMILENKADIMQFEKEVNNMDSN